MILVVALECRGFLEGIGCVAWSLLGEEPLLKSCLALSGQSRHGINPGIPIKTLRIFGPVPSGRFWLYLLAEPLSLTVVWSSLSSDGR